MTKVEHAQRGDQPLADRSISQERLKKSKLGESQTLEEEQVLNFWKAYQGTGGEVKVASLQSLKARK